MWEEIYTKISNAYMLDGASGVDLLSTVELISLPRELPIAPNDS